MVWEKPKKAQKWSGRFSRVFTFTLKGATALTPQLYLGCTFSALRSLAKLDGFGPSIVGSEASAKTLGFRVASVARLLEDC